MDLGRGETWSKTNPLNDPKTFGLIQPTILDHGSAGIQMLCRSKQKFIVESWSKDDGKSWGHFAATTLPNPNSGIDAVMLKDGRSLVDLQQHAQRTIALEHRGLNRWEIVEGRAGLGN